jgi:hypothetical protein
MNAGDIVWLVAVVVLVVSLAMLALRRFAARGTASVSGGAPPRAVDWPAPGACLPEAMVAECLAAARAVAGFGPVGEAERAALAQHAARINSRYGAARVTVAALVSMRTMEAAVAAGRGGVLAQRAGAKILAAYRAGVPVTEIAARRRLPPLAVARQLLIELGRSAADVRALLREPDAAGSASGQAKLRADPETRALADQLGAVNAADLGSRVNADRIRAGATAFEETVARFLTAAGVKFETEETLRAADVATPLTPDFLLREPVTIAGRPVYWIDAKAYPMYGSRLVTKKLAQQAQKYTAAFGPGAFVFAGGVMCRARVPPADPLLLDGMHLT